jgi:hypothetical protein
MSNVVAAVLGAVVVLIGSATVAALISAHWQRKHYEAEVLHEAFKSVMDARARLIVDAINVVGGLNSQIETGQLWESQRQEMKAALEATQQRAVDLVARVNVCAGLVEDPEFDAVLNAVADATRNIIKALMPIRGWEGIDGVEGARIITFRPGSDASSVAASIQAASHKLTDENMRFIQVVRSKRREFLYIRPRWMRSLSDRCRKVHQAIRGGISRQ